MRASGLSGRLRVGYQVAAALGPWSLVLEPGETASVLRADVRWEHQYWVTQRPLDVVLDMATVEWVWRDVSPRRDGQQLVVVLAERPIVEPRSAAPADAGLGVGGAE